MRLRMTRGYAVDLAEVLEIVHADLVAEEMKESILEHAPVAVGENEAIPIDPVWVLGVEGHELVKENVGDWCHAHGGTRMARVRLEGGIDLVETVSVTGSALMLQDRKSTRLNSSHSGESRMPSSA